MKNISRWPLTSLTEGKKSKPFPLNVIGFLPNIMKEKSQLKLISPSRKAFSQGGVHIFILNLLPLHRSDSD